MLNSFIRSTLVLSTLFLFPNPEAYGESLVTDAICDPIHSRLVISILDKVKRLPEVSAVEFDCKLISKINSALQRLKEGTYGFCEETGEPIGLKRLMARPVATLSIEAQERHERDEKIFVDD